MVLVVVGAAAAAVAAMLFLLRRWTARRERELGSDRFRTWFMRNYLGMKPLESAKVSTAEPADRNIARDDRQAARGHERRRE